ncbi:MAG: DUF4390 domain-containing protein, partial [Blastocatellia bacterium]|nr:DUF4390 domain-containing protein [Blastocatellia bacterium]
MSFYKYLITLFLFSTVALVATSDILADGIIHSLKSQLTSSEVLISYKLRGAMNEQTRASIDSGELTEFDYEVRLVEEHRFWFNRTVGNVRLSTSVKLDTLTKQYQLLRKIDYKVVETKTTARIGDVEEWLTSIENLHIAERSRLSNSKAYSLQVRAHLRS